MVSNLPAVQETTCNTEDTGLIPGSGISAGGDALVSTVQQSQSALMNSSCV